MASETKSELVDQLSSQSTKAELVELLGSRLKKDEISKLLDDDSEGTKDELLKKLSSRTKDELVQAVESRLTKDEIERALAARDDSDENEEEDADGLWDLAWAGEVTNDAFAPLRAPRLTLARQQRVASSARRFGRRDDRGRERPGAFGAHLPRRVLRGGEGDPPPA